VAEGSKVVQVRMLQRASWDAWIHRSSKSAVKTQAQATWFDATTPAGSV
jgi:hypothetical protein